MSLIPDHSHMDRSDTGARRGFGSEAAFVAFTITAILAAIQLFFIRPFFLVNDDIFKILTLKGITASGEASPFIGYSNVLLGYGLKALYTWNQTVPWYPLFLCLTQAASFFVLLWFSLRRSPGWFKAALFAGLWVSVYFIFFVFLQFTITALLAAQVGLTVLLGAGPSDKNRSGLIMTGVLLLWLSALVRVDSLGLAFLMALPMILYRAFDPSWRTFLRENQRWLGAAGLVLCGLVLFNYFWFQSDPAWKEYRRFDQARVAAQDYRVPSYTPESKPVFDSVHWTENDLWLFKNWYYTDPDKFNAPTFQKIGAAFPRWGSEGKIASFHSLEELLTSYWDARILVAFLLLLLLCEGEARKRWLLQFLWLLVLLVGMIYLLRAPDRVNLPLLLFLVNGALIEARSFGFQGKTRLFSVVKFLLLAGLFLSALPLLRDYYRQDQQRLASQAVLHDYLKEARPQPGTLYEIYQFPFEALGAFDDLECFRPYHPFLAVFCQTSPASLKGLENFGVKEPLRDSVNNPRVLWMCSAEQGAHYARYLRENFHQEIRPQLVFRCGAFQLFSIHSR